MHAEDVCAEAMRSLVKPSSPQLSNLSFTGNLELCNVVHSWQNRLRTGRLCVQVHAMAQWMRGAADALSRATLFTDSASEGFGVLPFVHHDHKYITSLQDS